MGKKTAGPRPYPYDVGEWVRGKDCFGRRFEFEVVSCPSAHEVCSVEENGTIYSTPTSLIEGSDGYVIWRRREDGTERPDFIGSGPRAREVLYASWDRDLEAVTRQQEDSNTEPDAGGADRASDEAQLDLGF